LRALKARSHDAQLIRVQRAALNEPPLAILHDHTRRFRHCETFLISWGRKQDTILRWRHAFPDHLISGCGRNELPTAQAMFPDVEHDV